LYIISIDLLKGPYIIEWKPNKGLTKAIWDERMDMTMTSNARSIIILQRFRPHICGGGCGV
jgi:hypothetical protein